MGSTTKTIRSARTTFEIIEQLMAMNGAGATELAGALGLAKSTVHAHLQTLAEMGYVVNEDGTYRVALRFMQLGMYARERSSLYAVAEEKVDEIAADTGEKVWCIAEEHGRSVHLYGASGKRSVRTYARTGDLGYLHQLAAGKAILAFLPEPRVEEIVDRHGLPARTEQTITDREDLFEELRQVRERGFAQNRQESLKGLHAVGVPIKNEDDAAIGAVSLSAPANRLKDDRFEREIPDLLLGAANEIEINLAYE